MFYKIYKPLCLIGEDSFRKIFKGINIENDEEICFKIEKIKKVFLNIESHVLETIKDGKCIQDFYLMILVKALMY